MRKLFPLFVIGLIINLVSFSQNNLATILAQKEVLVDYYDMSYAGSKILYLSMEYGKSVFTNEQENAIQKLQNADIVRIDLVYSDFPSKSDFTALTKKRFEALQRLLPNLNAINSIEYRKIRQTIGKSRETAAGLEHGFFIYFRPKPTKTSSKSEIEKLKILTGTSTVDTTKPGTGYSFWCWQIYITTDTTNNTGILPIPEGATRTISKIPLKTAIDKGYVQKDQEKLFKVAGDSVFKFEDRREEDCASMDGSFFLYDAVDTTVTEVFKRHNWKGSFFLVDVTGSMYPYTAQLLKWLKLNLTDKKKNHFVFFNDGDNKEEKDKIIGKIGGIYSVYTDKFDEVEKTITTAMTNGSGGDAPENNIEALLEADRQCSECDSIVMVADNWAPIKDISLISALHKPVKVVLCGVLGKINKDYLKLARDTKGSIHLIEEDIYSLSELKEGETIKIHGSTYKLLRGEFVEVTPKSI